VPSRKERHATSVLTGIALRCVRLLCPRGSEFASWPPPIHWRYAGEGELVPELAHSGPIFSDAEASIKRQFLRVASRYKGERAGATAATADCVLRILDLLSQGMRSHEWIDAPSLALHEAVAARLQAEPQLLEEVARANLRRWLAASSAAPLREWQRLLDTLSLSQLLQLLRSREEQAMRLRQSSPFAGLLTPAERQAILSRHESSFA
jgi:hypothetical protein